MVEQLRKLTFLRNCGYGFCGAGIFAGAAFVLLFIRMPHWIGYGRVAEFLYGFFSPAFVCAGAYLGSWLHERLFLQPEREQFTASIKLASDREDRMREAKERSEKMKQFQDAEDLDNLRKRCRQYETEVRVLRSELARHAKRKEILLCD